MQMLVSKNSLFGSDGSGNQKKVWMKDGLFKIDSKLGESVKEVDAYKFAKMLGIPCAEYYAQSIEFSDGRVEKGVLSISYNKSGDSAYTLSEILDIVDYTPTTQTSTIDYINCTIDIISNFSGISTVTVEEYIYTMLLFDFLIVNTDRHLSNIEILENNGNFRFAPLFDHGQSFFGVDKVMTANEYEAAYHKIKSKPFSTNPLKNLGDLKKCEQIFKRLDFSNFQNLDIMEGHKLTIKRQLDKLQEKFNKPNRNLRDTCKNLKVF